MKLIINLHNVSGCGGVGSKDVTLDEAYDNSPSGDKFITIDDGAIELNGTNVTGLLFDGTSFNQTPRTIPAVPAQDSVEVYATTETVGGSADCSMEYSRRRRYPGYSCKLGVLINGYKTL